MHQKLTFVSEYLHFGNNVLVSILNVPSQKVSDRVSEATVGVNWVGERTTLKVRVGQNLKLITHLNFIEYFEINGKIK